MNAHPMPRPGLRGTVATVLGTVLLTLAIMLAMVQRAAEPEPPATTERSRARALETDCRHACSAWIVSQCNAQNAGRAESVFKCAGRLAPILQNCLDRCRGR